MSDAALLLLGGTSRPAVPTRLQACTVRCPFQGLTIQQSTYVPAGQTAPYPLPWWSTVITAFPSELEAIAAQIKAAGFTHELVSLVWDYGETGQPYGTGQLVPPVDLRDNLRAYVAYVDRVLATGLLPVFMLPGEGQAGLAWIRSDAFPQVVAALRQGYDRTQYGPFWFGYDGTWPAAWSVEDVQQILPYIRRVIGDGAYFGLMFGCGPAGNPYFYVTDAGDWAQPWMQAIDCIGMTYGPDQVQYPSLANGMQYLTELSPYGKTQRQWAEEPTPTACGTPRGPYICGVIEWATYAWVRGWPTWNGYDTTASGIAADRARMAGAGVIAMG